MKASGIYKITNKTTGKFYIGSSSISMHTRWNNHRTHLRRGSHSSRYMQNAWNKYGEQDFIFEAIIVCSPDDCLFYEQLALDAYKPSYNAAPVAGSVRGIKHTEETVETYKKCHRVWRKKYPWKGRQMILKDIAEMESVNYELLIGRVLNAKMDIVKAVTMGKQPFRKTYEHEGKAMTIKQWAQELNMHPRRITYWLDSGMTIADCILRLNREAKRLSLQEFCRLSGANQRTVKSRLKKGMSIMEAITAPVRVMDNSWRSGATA